MLQPVRGADPEEQGHRVGDLLADEVDDFEGEARAVLEAAAVFIRARVGDRTAEGVEEVAVRVVDLDDVEACSQRSARRGHECGFHVVDVAFAHLLWLREPIGVGDGGWALDVVGPAVVSLAGDIAGAEPGGDGAGFAAGVCELYADLLGLRVCELDDLLQGWNLAVGPEAGVFGRYAPFGEDGGGFDEGEAGPTLDDAA